MATDKGSQVSSDRQRWQKIFNALVQMLRTQQTQLESLAKERKLLEDRIKLQYERWLSGARLLEDQIALMEMEYTEREKERFFEASKLDLLMSLKEGKVSLCQLKLESADSELADFKALIDSLSHPKGFDQNSMVADKEKNTKEQEQRIKKLEVEARRLKSDYRTHSLRHSAKVSALLAEQNFVWNQYKIMEGNFSNKLKNKHIEVEQANEKIQSLRSGMQQLESLNNEKDIKIGKLKSDLAKMEADTMKKNEEISRLSKELELLQKSGSASVTPRLNQCTEKHKTSSSEGKNRGKVGRKSTEKKESSASEKDTGKERKGSKRKEMGATPRSEATRLFSSSFKVPKLKDFSNPVV